MYKNLITLLDEAFLCSILGRIVRVTDEVVEYRKWIKEHYPTKPSEPKARSYASVANSPSPVKNKLSPTKKDLERESEQSDSSCSVYKSSSSSSSVSTSSLSSDTVCLVCQSPEF